MSTVGSKTLSTELGTTSYALLMLLSVKSWTGYELAQQSRRSLAYVWPKEDSVVYKESRRLVRLGLATTDAEQHNGRDRKRYQITQAGREALRAWLDRPSAPPRFEMEPVIRLLAAQEGEPAQALAAVETMRSWSAELRAGNTAIGREYRAGTAQFQDRAHINVVAGVLFDALHTAVVDWAEWAAAEIATWDRTDGLGMTPGVRRKLDEALGGEDD